MKCLFGAQKVNAPEHAAYYSLGYKAEHFKFDPQVSFLRIFEQFIYIYLNLMLSS